MSEIEFWRERARFLDSVLAGKPMDQAARDEILLARAYVALVVHDLAKAAHIADAVRRAHATWAAEDALSD
jgi:hypothetical protein